MAVSMAAVLTAAAPGAVADPAVAPVMTAAVGTQQGSKPRRPPARADAALDRSVQ